MNDIAKPARRDLKDTLLAPEMAQVFSALVPRHVTPERLVRLSVSCVTRTPRLLEVPQVQVLGALVQCASLGLEPNSPLQHVHLIPFKNNRTNRYDLQVIIGYRGFVELGRRTGKQRWVHGDVVRPGDEFTYSYGNDAHLRHRPGRGAEKRQDPTDAYCFVQLDDGFAFVVLPEWEVMRHREHSFAWRQDGQKSPWGQHPDRMWRKTAIRVLYSGGEVPLDTELAMAVNTDDQRMDYRAMGELAMKGGKAALEHLKEGMDTFVSEQDEEPEGGEAEPPSMQSQVRRPSAPAQDAAQSSYPARQQATESASVSSSQDAPAHAQEAQRRGRRTQEQITADMIASIERAQTGGEINEVLESKLYGSRSVPDKERIARAANVKHAEFEARARSAIQKAKGPETIARDIIAEIAATAPEHVSAVLQHHAHAIQALPEDVRQEVIVAAQARAGDNDDGGGGPDPDRGNLDDWRASTPDLPTDFDRGEPQEEDSPTFMLLTADYMEAGPYPPHQFLHELRKLVKSASPLEVNRLRTYNDKALKEIIASGQEWRQAVAELWA